jgi:predicted Zn-dependent protease
VDLLDDAELSAALAHELGHLLGRPDARGALAEEANADSLEQAADRRGCALLAQHGVSRDSMLAMLEKLAAALRRPPPLLRRIDAARTTCGARQPVHP